MIRPAEGFPYSPEAEKSVLSAMLNSDRATAVAIEKLGNDSFFSTANRQTFKAMSDMYKSGVEVDVTTLVDNLKGRGLLEDVGGLGFISDLVTYASPDKIDSYVKLLTDKYTLRRLLHAASAIESAVYNAGAVDAKQALEVAESEVFSVSSDMSKSDVVDMRSAIKDTFDSLEERISAGGRIPGIPTGFKYLDRMTAGFKPGQLIIIAGRPGMGKTSFALNLAMNAAMHENVGTVVFSLEMSREELTERMLSADAEVDSQKLRIGDVDDRTSEKLSYAAGRLSGSPLFINDSASMTPMEMRANLQRLVIDSEHKIGLVVVDYLQLMTSGDPQLSRNRVQDVTKISRDLKVLARDLEVPVVALSQLNRGIEHRDDRTPQLSDLRESGSIEQDADVVMFLHREEVVSGPYDKAGKDVRGLAEVVVGKQRSGPIGKVTLRFVAEHTKFTDNWNEPVTEENEDEQVFGLPFD